jgi:hypothetical protein
MCLMKYPQSAQKNLLIKGHEILSRVSILDGRVKPFTGIVVAVEDNGDSAPTGKRWRITIDHQD